MDEQLPQFSIDPDTIDLLDQPTKCSLVVDAMGCRMEVGKGLVYPHVASIDEVPIRAEYAVVKVDMVHENAKNFRLEVPPDDTIVTLQDAVTRRVQWRRSFIDVDPEASASQNPPPASAFSEPRPELPLPEMAFLSPPRTHSTPTLPPMKPTRPNPVRVKTKPVQRKSRAQKGKEQLKDISKEVAKVWTSANKKYVAGKAMLSPAELRQAGQQCMHLHHYYMNNYKTISDIVVSYKKKHFLIPTDGVFVVSFADLYDLFTLDALDISLLRCFVL